MQNDNIILEFRIFLLILSITMALISEHEVALRIYNSTNGATSLNLTVIPLPNSSVYFFGQYESGPSRYSLGFRFSLIEPSKGCFFNDQGGPLCTPFITGTNNIDSNTQHIINRLLDFASDVPGDSENPLESALDRLTFPHTYLIWNGDTNTGV